MHIPNQAKLLDAYRALPGDLQILVNLLAVYYGYCSLTNIGKCLAGLGIKEGNRVLKAETVKARLRPLIAEGLLEENVRPGGTRCNRNLVESITRQLVAEQEFEKYAAQVFALSSSSQSYYRYNTADDCVREARIHFHRGDYQQMQTCLDLGRRYPGNLPSHIDLYLSWFLNPFDSAWFQKHHPVILPEMASYACLHQLIYLYRQPQLEAFFQQLLDSDEGRRDSVFTRLFLELKLLRGEWAQVGELLIGAADPELLAIAALLAFLHGDYAGAVSRFETALSQLRKLSGQRNAYFYGLAGIFYPLAVLKSGDSKLRNKLNTLLNQAVKGGGYWSGVYQYLSMFLQYLQGDLQVRDELLQIPALYRVNNGFRESGTPETVAHMPLLQPMLLQLIKFWVKADFATRVEAVDQQLYSHLAGNGYGWPAAELAKVFSHLEHAKSPQWDQDFFKQGHAALADLFVSRADWEVALDALLNLPVGDKKTASASQTEKPTRLVWLLSYDERDKHIDIEPREQKQQAKGGWSKGRAVALKRLAHERQNFDYLSEQDHKICAHIKEYRDTGWYGSGVSFEFDSSVTQALIGHPLLFWADAHEVRVDVVKGEAELRVKKLPKTDKIKISLEPAPGHEQKFHISKETPTRLRVVEFSADHHKVYSVLGPKGLEVPASAQEKVLQTLTSISGLLTVHSDIGGSSSTAEQVKADATPRIHLLPHGEGLRVAVLVRPFADGGAYFQPGQGGESVLAEIDGKRLQTQRDLKREQSLAAAAINACPALQDAERDSAGDWLLEHPEACLEFLLQAQALPDSEAMLEWPEGVRFKVLGQSSGSGFSVQIKRDNDWFALQGELKVNDDTILDMQQLLGLLDNRQGRFLQLKDGQFIALTDEFRRRLEDLKAYAEISGKKVRLNPLAALTLEDWQDEAGFKADKHWQNHIQRLQQARDYRPQVPSTFQAELRDYQLDGYRWLARLAQWGVGACLADDMGLGKTVQGLALLVERAPAGPSLIVAPTSVCANWENEARRFAPTLNPMVLGGGDRQRLLENLRPFDVLICSYGLLQQEQVAELLAEIPFQTAVLDEAQWIKNIATRRSQGAMNLQAEFKIIMTGTPLENHLGELWNLFRFINPGLLGSMEQFNQRFAGPIERDRNTQAKQQLKKLIQPFILRRTKTQVLQELPPRTEIPIYIELSQEEKVFYEALRRDSIAMLGSSDAPPGQKQLQILAAITKLRRSCCNTRLVNADLELPSSKLAAFGEIVEELLDNKHKALVFSQFVDHLQLIKGYIEQRGIAYQYLDGSTPVKERQKRVDAFQRGEGELFLISLKAGGVGLNLTAADYVIHMDPWWNPAVEDQASDRAHRMGQQRPVTIYRMIAKNTIEEKIVALHSHKRDLADSLLDGADISGKMSADDLLGLMKGE
ncbi:DEAD/DEAH box helicase [Methylomonas methanica]|uniref:SNF2-related protein n=1 Tax=Methylomonas methanica (strain DSM 25384 / MC09) TaxID=857087 RepID=F9ZZ51_METMM|nr:DEAD/DEAH box helicase [Methylomonas methanica]AEG01077.1 SNF2-related protein [Methylomonas methanica MC09]